MNANWSLDSGRTVDFRVVERPGVDSRNPFKQYQRRRSGRLGQRFHMVIVPDGFETPTYDGEAMLRAWGDTEKGQTVGFWLDNEAAQHPFAGLTRRTPTVVGQLFAGAFVILDCDGSPVDVEAQAALEDSSASRGRKLSSQAHLIITGQRFCQYLEETSGWTAKLRATGRSWTPEQARLYVKWRIEVESLSDLDRDAKKATAFHELIRKPFALWNGDPP